MRRIIAGNWKMNTNHAESVILASAIEDGVSTPDVEVIIFPPFPYLESVKDVVKEVKVGAQDCFYEDEGAFTGEVSAKQIQALLLFCRPLFLPYPLPRIE